MKLLHASVFLAFQFALIAPASALEAQPGDACPVVGRYTLSGGPELSGITHQMVCNASNVWSSVLDNDAAGNVSLVHAVSLTGDISPAQITANQNDYNPAGLSTASVLRLSADASRSISGLAGGADGRIITLMNVDTTDTITLVANSASSTAANRFGFTGNLALAPKQATMIMYDSTASLWRLVGADAGNGGGGTPAGSDSQLQFNNGGSFGADSNLVWDNTTKNLGVGMDPIQPLAVKGNILSLVGPDPAAPVAAPLLGAAVATGFSSTVPVLSFWYQDGTGIANPATNMMSFLTDSSERIRITDTGNVGIGTATPADSLHVYQATPGENAGITIDNDGTGASQQSWLNLVTKGDGSHPLGTAGVQGWQIWADADASTTLGYVGGANGFGIGYTGGSNWNDVALVIQPTDRLGIFNPYPGAGLDVGTSVALSGDISPAQITADKNNYNPTNLAKASVLRLTSDASRTITGLAGGVDGRIITILNVGSNSITLANQSTSSTTTNRFAIGADITIAADQSVSLIYDATSQRWRSASIPFSVGGTTYYTGGLCPEGETFEEGGSGKNGVWSDGTYVYGTDNGNIYADTFTTGVGWNPVATSATLTDGDNGGHIWGDGTYIYVADGSAGLRAYTFNGTTFTLVATYNSAGTAIAVWGDGTYLYLADNGALRALSFNGTTFTLLASATGGTNISRVWASGGYIYYADPGAGRVRAYTFNGTAFTLKATRSISQVQGITGDGTYVYTTGQYGGAEVLTFSGSAFTYVADFPYSGWDLVAKNGFVYASTMSGLQAFKFDGTNIRLIGTYPNYNSPTQIAADNGHVYEADYTFGSGALTLCNGTTQTGYFVLTNSTWNGNLGGLSGANSKCLTELTTNTTWKYYAAANSAGLLDSTHVKAWLCYDQDASGTCQNLTHNTQYYFAKVGSATDGGASFTTDNLYGVAPGDLANWSGATYFNGSYDYWTSRYSDPDGDKFYPTTSDSINGDCVSWSSASSGQGGDTGISDSANAARWADTENTCNTTRRLICSVNP